MFTFHYNSSFILHILDFMSIFHYLQLNLVMCSASDFFFFLTSKIENLVDPLNLYNCHNVWTLETYKCTYFYVLLGYIQITSIPLPAVEFRTKVSYMSSTYTFGSLEPLNDEMEVLHHIL